MYNIVQIGVTEEVKNFSIITSAITYQSLTAS